MPTRLAQRAQPPGVAAITQEPPDSVLRFLARASQRSMAPPIETQSSSPPPSPSEWVPKRLGGLLNISYALLRVSAIDSLFIIQ